jgi:hypothetical protein
MHPDGRLASSFRDPSGFIFKRDGILYRQVNQSYREHFDALSDSGLYDALVAEGLLVAHEHTDIEPPTPDIAHTVIAPETIPFVSYPYEWCLSALKSAALATLAIHEKALEHDMVLKDASAYNIQIVDAKPMLIDTLSFERYREGEPWVAYRQFCQHFLAPLALMSRRDIRLNQLMRVYIDGVPLDLAKRMLPKSSLFSVGLLLHIHVHAWSQSRHADAAGGESAGGHKKRTFTRRSMQGLIESLRSAVRKLNWEPRGTEWGAYYDDTNYSSEARSEKAQHVRACLERIAPNTVWDLGANTGVYSRMASETGAHTVAFDIDPAAVEQNFRYCEHRGEKNLLPLSLDLTNPSPALGWHNRERDSLAGRGPADAVMALALVHHLAISNNVPLPMVADYFADLGRRLIIEFVPKSDSQVQRLLATREDVFPDYHKAGFEAAFSARFTIEDQWPIGGSERTLYLMRQRDAG